MIFNRLSIHSNDSIIRPPDMVVGGHRFYHGFFFLSLLLTVFLSFFFRPLISQLAERNLTITGHMVGSKCDLKMHVRNLGYPFLYKSGARKPPFSTISQLKDNFNGLYLRNLTGYAQAGNCIANYKGSPTSSQCDMNFGPQTATSWRWVVTHPL